MKGILLCLFFFALINVSALEFSPTSLEFNMKQNEHLCKSISLKLDTQASLSDLWAVNPAEEWSMTKFTSSSQDLGVQITYPSNLEANQQEAQVCLSSPNLGDKKGALVFNQEQTGNSIVQFVVWLKVRVSSDTDNTPPNQLPENPPSSSGSSSSRKGTSRNSVIYSSPPPPPVPQIQELNLPLPDKEIKLKAPANKIKSTPQKINLLPITLSLTTVLILFTFLILLITKRKV